MLRDEKEDIEVGERKAKERHNWAREKTTRQYVKK